MYGLSSTRKHCVPLLNGCLCEISHSLYLWLEMMFDISYCILHCLFSWFVYPPPYIASPTNEMAQLKRGMTINSNCAKTIVKETMYSCIYYQLLHSIIRKRAKKVKRTHAHSHGFVVPIMASLRPRIAILQITLNIIDQHNTCVALNLRKYAKDSLQQYTLRLTIT